MTEYTFNDVKFMTAKEKQLTLKAWITFLKHGLQFKHFTKRIYDHLHIHCSFIAHYNIHGFYQTYFEDPDSTLKFLKQFDKDYSFRSVEYGYDLWLNGEYEDLNKAMIEEFEKLKPKLYHALNAQLVESKKQSYELAKADYENTLRVSS